MQADARPRGRVDHSSGPAILGGAMAKKKTSGTRLSLAKSPTGISGLDLVTGGGLPTGRPTLVCGNAGCGKTLLGMEFLVKGATLYDEPGVFISFEESEEELAQNVASLNWDLQALAARKKISLDHIHLDPSQIEETGQFTLDGLFIRIESAVRAVKAKRIVIDALEVLFGSFTDKGLLRGEFHRLFRWLKERGLTAVITGEQGEQSFTRHGLEEYVSDCVIFLDHRLAEQVAVRRLRIVKYRGTSHGTNEYPFLIDDKGFSVLPITSLDLDHEVSDQRLSSGIPRLDAMLGGEGFYRGSSILVSGTAGTGKTSVAAAFVDAACRRGEKALYFSFEESPQQIIRNMGSIGLNLNTWVRKKRLAFRSMRITTLGIEAHLATILKHILEFGPDIVVIDPISNLSDEGGARDSKAMLTRVLDFMKKQGITSLFTDLARAGKSAEATDTEISSLMDSWLMLRDIELNGERNRGMYVLKSRGTAHSNQIREFLLTDRGIELIDVYVGPGGVLTGTSRVAQEAQEGDRERGRLRKVERLRKDLELKRTALESDVASLRARLALEIEEIEGALEVAEREGNILLEERTRMGRMRGLDR
jgi:circadian clock protein KaiC